MPGAPCLIDSVAGNNVGIVGAPGHPGNKGEVTPDRHESDDVLPCHRFALASKGMLHCKPVKDLPAFDKISSMGFGPSQRADLLPVRLTSPGG